MLLVKSHEGIKMSELQKPFARWRSFGDCEAEQMQMGHSKESADKICGAIQARAEKGVLFKAMFALEILKAKGDDLIVGGYASWETEDAENDYVTTEAQVSFLTKFFAMPPEYRSISIDHTNFRIGTAIIQYPPENPEYFSHVHEKGMYLLAKIRNDNMKKTQHYRQLIKDGTYKMFSIGGEALRCDGPCERALRTEKLRKIFDIDPFEVGIVKEGMNPKAAFEVLKGKCPPCIEHFKATYMAKGFGEKEALDLAEKLFNRVYERIQTEEAAYIQKPDEQKPPEDWWDACVANVEGADPAAVCGHIFYHVLGGDRSKADPSMFKKGKQDLAFKEEFEQIFHKHFPNHKR